MQILFTEPFIVCVDLLYFFFLDKILSIDKIDSLCFHGSLQCVVIQKFSLNVVQSSKFIQVLILTKNHHFSKLVLIYGITTIKSTYHSNGSSSYSVIQNLVPNFRCSANVCSSLRWSSQRNSTFVKGALEELLLFIMLITALNWLFSELHSNVICVTKFF